MAGNKITTKALIESVAGQVKMSKARVKEVLGAFSEAIVSHCQAGDAVQVQGLGKFYPQQRAERRALNLATGKAVNVPAKRVLAFKAFSGIRELKN